MSLRWSDIIVRRVLQYSRLQMILMDKIESVLALLAMQEWINAAKSATLFNGFKSSSAYGA